MTQKLRVAACLSILASIACASRKPEPAARREPTAGATMAEPPPAPSASERTAATPEPAPTTLPTKPETSFPPAPIAPPFERSAAPDDGHWAPLGDAAHSERAAGEPRVLYRTVLHPHPISRFLSMTIAAVDLESARVHWTPGTDDPKPGDVAQRAGLVATDHRDTVIAVFNGGFQAQHGRWGMMSEGTTLVPPRTEGCTIALYADGSVRIGAWPELAATLPDMVSLRQTPPCLVDEGRVHEKLLAGNDKAWGGKLADLKTRRRSAVGIDGTGRILLYGLGEEVDARYLAEGMRAAGAKSAAELDINWNWARFLLVGRSESGADSSPEITSSLVSGMPHGKREYLTRPSQRDFFYVVRKGPAAP